MINEGYKQKSHYVYTEEDRVLAEKLSGLKNSLENSVITFNRNVVISPHMGGPIEKRNKNLLFMINFKILIKY